MQLAGSQSSSPVACRNNCKDQDSHQGQHGQKGRPGQAALRSSGQVPFRRVQSELCSVMWATPCPGLQGPEVGCAIDRPGYSAALNAFGATGARPGHWRAVYCCAADGACGTTLPKSAKRCRTHCPENVPQNLCHWPQMQDVLCLLGDASQEVQVQSCVLTVSLCM